MHVQEKTLLDRIMVLYALEGKGRDPVKRERTVKGDYYFEVVAFDALNCFGHGEGAML